MQLDIGSLIAGLLIAAFSAGMSAAATFALFHFNREQQYHSTLSEQYGKLFSQYRRMRSAILSDGNRHDAATEVYGAILTIKLIDRSEARLQMLDKIRASTKILAEHLPALGSSTQGDIQIHTEMMKFHDAIEELIPKLRSDLIDNRPMKNFV